MWPMQINSAISGNLLCDGRINSAISGNLLCDGRINSAISGNLLRDGRINSAISGNLLCDGRINSAISGNLLCDGRVIVPANVIASGAGADGLSTAVCILEELPGRHVTIIADIYMAVTASHCAAGIFRPTTEKTPEKSLEEF
ncbi:hypothetical protein DPMN_177332 [Dreissena polymorpha]|uniref:Uncharacterized protein n=1 Tax=Dreissena polymorpha TaxID=45954 RepID=A0A9D4ED34_DREPO|nr:hypothetical protein DPMN_177332 [Dreissena polymorpha]